MRIISGDWRIDAEVSLRVSVTGAVTALVLPVSTFAYEDIHVRKILRVFHLNDENQEDHRRNDPQVQKMFPSLQ